MKKMLWRILPVFLVLAVIQSCDEPLLVDDSIDKIEMELKSASIEKQSYIVVLNDAECISMMKQFITENPALWNEDIGL